MQMYYDKAIGLQLSLFES